VRATSRRYEQDPGAVDDAQSVEVSKKTRRGDGVARLDLIARDERATDVLTPASGLSRCSSNTWPMTTAGLRDVLGGVR
jgi:hypothetical protein